MCRVDVLQFNLQVLRGARGGSRRRRRMVDGEIVDNIRQASPMRSGDALRFNWQVLRGARGGSRLRMVDGEIVDDIRQTSAHAQR